MRVSLRYNWILSCLGLFGVAFSLVLLFATPVFAACSATVRCANGSFVSCDCPTPNGVCTSGTKCVSCVCSNNQASEPICCGGGGED